MITKYLSIQIKGMGRLLVTILAIIALSLLVTAFVVQPFGVSAKAAFQSIFAGAFGSPASIGNTLNKATPLLLVALSFIVAKSGGNINIGGEGQIFLGALFATIFALAFANLPFPVPMLLALIGSILGGGLWGALAGYLKTHRNVNEVISTLLLNFVAVSLIALMVQETWLLREPITNLNSIPQSPRISESSVLPQINLAWISRVHWGFLIAGIASIAVYTMMTKTVLGFKVKAAGKNALAAMRAGIDVAKITITSMFIAGSLSGLAGGILVLGEQFRLRENLSSGYGFDGIVVALVASNQPLNAIPVAIVLGAIRAGGGFLEVRERVPASLVQITQGLALLLIAATANRVAKFTNKKSEE